MNIEYFFIGLFIGAVLPHLGRIADAIIDYIERKKKNEHS